MQDCGLKSFMNILAYMYQKILSAFMSVLSNPSPPHHWLGWWFEGEAFAIRSSVAWSVFCVILLLCRACHPPLTGPFGFAGGEAQEAWRGWVGTTLMWNGADGTMGFLCEVQAATWPFFFSSVWPLSFLIHFQLFSFQEWLQGHKEGNWRQRSAGICRLDCGLGVTVYRPPAGYV
jgi:hypothetical protein